MNMNGANKKVDSHHIPLFLSGFITIFAAICNSLLIFIESHNKLQSAIGFILLTFDF